MATLPVLSRDEFDKRVSAGAKWLIIDGTIVNVEDLVRNDDGLHKAGSEVLQVGKDITDMFKFVHTNLPRMNSLHSEGQTIMEHIRDKIALYAVAVLDTRADLPPLSQQEHLYWKESMAGPTYSEIVSSSLAMEGVDPAARIMQAVASLPVNSPRWRAFWAVIGALVADAAAQPTHWNYKVTYFQADLQARGKWDAPEFVRDSMNAFYRVPLGSHSNYGDQAVEQLHSLVDRKGLDPVDVERRYFARFGESYETFAKDHRKKLPITGPYRHGSLTEFVKNVESGRHWPDCGSNDAQADCFCKVVPVVALYAGRPEMAQRVSEAVRVTQNTQAAVDNAQAFAHVLEAIIMDGASGLAAVQASLEKVGEPTLAQAMQNAVDVRAQPYPEAVLALSGGSYSMSKIA